MKKWIKPLLPLTLICLTSSSANNAAPLAATVKMATINEMDYLRQEVSCYEALLATKHKEHKTKVKRTKTRNLNSINIFKIDSSVDFRIKNTLENALRECTFEGEAIISSGLRSSCTNSQHSKGEAIDISWRRKGKAFGEWLGTESGENWLKAHNLDFYYENISCKKDHPKYFYNSGRINGKRIVAHIHLYMKK